VNPENRGTGYSREKGVELSVGEYIGFLDSDDSAEPDAYQRMYERAAASNADILIADYFTYNDGGESYDSDYIPTDALSTHKSAQIFKYQLRRIKVPYYLRVDWWNKIYRRQLFIDHQIRFPHVVRNEGTMSMVMTLVASKIAVYDRKLFHTVHRLGSVCRTFKYKNVKDIKTSTLHFMEWMKKLGYWEEFEGDLVRFFLYVLFNHNMQLILKLPKAEREASLEWFCTSLRDDKRIFVLFLKYLNYEEKSVERLVYASLCNARSWSVVSKIKGVDFFERHESSPRLIDRSKLCREDLVTVVTICKDLVDSGRLEVFERMVRSVREQTYGVHRIEHIVIDALSMDGTREYLEQLVESGKIDYWVSERDSGIYNAMNKGPDFALGQYIIFLNSDDYLDVTALEKLVGAIEDSEADYSYANAYKVTDSEEKVGTHIGDLNKVYFGAPYCHQALLVRKACFDRVRFDESFRITMWMYSLRLVEERFRSCYVNEYLAFFRVGGVSTNDTHQEKFVAEQTKIKKEYILPRVNITYDEYEFINHTFRRWRDAPKVDVRELNKKIESMRKKGDEFCKGFSESVLKLVEFNGDKAASRM